MAENYSCASLNDFDFCLDGQACHGVSVVSTPVFCFLLRAKVILSLLSILTLLVQHFAIAKFLSTLGSLYLFQSFVRRWSSFRWCLPPHPFITFRLHPPPYIERSFSSCCFGLNHFYQSSLYRLNSNPSPRHYIVISSSRFLLAKPLYQTAVSPIISSSICLPRGAIPALCLHWFAIYPNPVLERISALRYFDLYLALCVLCSALACHLAISSLCSSVSTRNTIKISSTFLGTGVSDIRHIS